MAWQLDRTGEGPRGGPVPPLHVGRDRACDLSSGKAVQKANSLFLNINDRFSKDDDAVYKKQLRDYQRFLEDAYPSDPRKLRPSTWSGRGSVAAEERSSRTPH